MDHTHAERDGNSSRARSSGCAQARELAQPELTFIRRVRNWHLGRWDGRNRHIDPRALPRGSSQQCSTRWRKRQQRRLRTRLMTIPTSGASSPLAKPIWNGTERRLTPTTSNTKTKQPTTKHTKNQKTTKNPPY